MNNFVQDTAYITMMAGLTYGTAHIGQSIFQINPLEAACYTVAFKIIMKFKDLTFQYIDDYEGTALARATFIAFNYSTAVCAVASGILSPTQVLASEFLCGVSSAIKYLLFDLS